MKKYILTVLAALLTSCASLHPQGQDDADIDPFELRDPIRPVNHAVFSFNLKADKYAVKPVADTWHHAPSWVRSGASNFLSNLGEPANVINGVLQLNPDIAFTALGRFIINSTVGVAGLADVAADNGINNKGTAFAETLGHYGVTQGAYVVLPLAGPSTVRDTTGLVVDWFMDPVGWFLTTPQSVAQATSDAIVAREESGDIVDQLYYTSIDPYTASRAAYLQHQAFIRQ